MLQLIYAVSLNDAAGAVEIAFWAHVGGFLSGTFALGSRRTITWLRNVLRSVRSYTLLRQAISLANKRAWAKAWPLLERVQPASAAVLNILSWSCAASGRAEAATSLARHVLQTATPRKQASSTINAFYLLISVQQTSCLDMHDHLITGRSFAAAGKFRHAISVYLEGLRKFPDHAQADAVLFNLAELYEQTGNRERACQILDLLTRAFPESEFARAAQWQLGVSGS